MYTQEILTLTQNKLNTLLNQASLAYQEGRAEDYDRFQEQIEEVQKLIEKINS